MTSSLSSQDPSRSNFRMITSFIISVLIVSLVSQVNAAPTRHHSRANHSQMTLNGVKQSSFSSTTTILASNLDIGLVGGSNGGGLKKVHHRSQRKRSLLEEEEEDSHLDSNQLSSRDQVTWAVGVDRILANTNPTSSKSHSNATTASNRKTRIHENLKVLQNLLHDSKGLKGGSASTSKSFKATVVKGSEVQFITQQTQQSQKSPSKSGINLDFTLKKLNQFKSKWYKDSGSSRVAKNETSITGSNGTSSSTSMSNSTVKSNSNSTKDSSSTSPASLKTSEAHRAASVAQAALDANATSDYGAWKFGDTPSAATLSHAAEGGTVQIIDAKNQTSTSTSNSTNLSTASLTAAIASAASPSISSKPQSFLSSSAGLAGPKSVVMLLTSNDENYGPAAVLADLRSLQKWADDVGSLTKAEESEVVAAVLSASARYFPELPTKQIARVILSDMKAESDFSAKLISPGRLDSGSSYGIMQVSPGNGSQELSLFKDHVVSSTNKRSWVMEASAYNVLSNGKWDESAGRNDDNPLLNWKTGKRLVPSSLTKNDLFSPWVNIHIAAWIQSNSARTKSQDPYNWMGINKLTQKTQVLAQTLSKTSTSSSARSTIANDLFNNLTKLDEAIDGDKLTKPINPTVATALGE